MTSDQHRAAMKLLPKSKCLGCGKEVDAASSLLGDRMPTSNDVTICLYCGHLMGYTKDMTLRPLTDSEMIELAGNEDMLRIQRLRGAAKDKGII